VTSEAGDVKVVTKTSDGGVVAERCVRADRVVMTPPALDDDLSFAKRLEDLAIEQLVSQASVEAFDVAPKGYPARNLFCLVAL
jgi:hypothetical protein